MRNKVELPEEALRFFREKGKQGGNSTKSKYGTQHFREMAQKRWAKRSHNTNQNQEDGKQQEDSRD